MNIKSLKEKCQSSRRTCDTWHGRNIARKLSIYITLLFVKLKIRAMTATTIFVLSGIAACLMFSMGTKTAFLAGALMLQVWYILDHVDGEVARYNEESSLTGVYYDELSHYLVHPLVFFSIGLGLFRHTGRASLIITGFAAGLGIVLLSLVVDLKKLVILEHTQKSRITAECERKEEKHGKGSFVKALFSKVHAFCTFPFIMNMITFAAFMDMVIKTDMIICVLATYTGLINFVWISRLIVFVKQRRVDCDV